jgi:hypothetical protein
VCVRVCVRVRSHFGSSHFGSSRNTSAQNSTKRGEGARARGIPSMSKRNNGRDGDGGRGRPQWRESRGRTPGRRDDSSVPAPWLTQPGQPGGGTWDCMRCYNTANYADRSTCNDCGGDRQKENPQWQCRSGGCRHKNLNTKILCHKCHAWRPDGTMVGGHGSRANATTRNRAERDKVTAARHGGKEDRKRAKREERRAGEVLHGSSSASRRPSGSTRRTRETSASAATRAVEFAAVPRGQGAAHAGGQQQAAVGRPPQQPVADHSQGRPLG